MNVQCPVRPLASRTLAKVWGRQDIPPCFATGGASSDAIGEIWFEASPESPLLVKYLFTSAKLSIQVHPSDEEARAIGHSCGKDEAWLVISAEPGAVIGAGFEAALTADELRAAAIDGSVEELMTWHEVMPGDFFYVPAGTVHAIGAGLSLLEIQQNVDLTYRLFDYGRTRALQIDEGIAVSRPGPFVPRLQEPSACRREVLSSGPKIAIERLTGPSEQVIAASADAPVWIIPISGRSSIGAMELTAGSVWLAEASATIDLGPGDCIIAARACDTERE